jgi:hypothetical protein
MNNERYPKQSQIKANFKRRNTLLCLPEERLPRQLTIDYLPEVTYSFDRKGKLAVSR